MIHVSSMRRSVTKEKEAKKGKYEVLDVANGARWKRKIKQKRT